MSRGNLNDSVPGDVPARRGKAAAAARWARTEAKRTTLVKLTQQMQRLAKLPVTPDAVVDAATVADRQDPGARVTRKFSL